MDPALAPAPVPPDEAGRVAALHRLGVLDQSQDEELDALTRLASYVCGTPTAALNLIDAHRQWQASTYGLEPVEVDRSDSLCARSILSREVTYTPDASQHRLFAANPWVSGQKGSVRLYAAAPLVLDDGHVVGTLCAFAAEPARLTPTQIDRLRDLAATAVRLLELRHAARDLAQVADHDPLTGLPNRSILRESMVRALARRDRSPSDPGLLFLDLDGFKRVNDAHGHAAGDLVLQEVASRLRGCVRASDLVARLGGDEFVVLLESGDLADPNAALEGLGGRLREALHGSHRLPDGSEVRLDASVGMVHPESLAESADSLLARADAAMYHDKARLTRS